MLLHPTLLFEESSPFVFVTRDALSECIQAFKPVGELSASEFAFGKWL